MPMALGLAIFHFSPGFYEKLEIPSIISTVLSKNLIPSGDSGDWMYQRASGGCVRSPPIRIRRKCAHL